MTGCSFLRFFFPILKCSHNSLCESYFCSPFRDENTKVGELFLGCLLAYEGALTQEPERLASGLWSWLVHGWASKVRMGVEFQPLADGKGVQPISLQATTPASSGEDSLSSDKRPSQVCLASLDPRSTSAAWGTGSTERKASQSPQTLGSHFPGTVGARELF